MFFRYISSCTKGELNPYQYGAEKHLLSPISAFLFIKNKLIYKATHLVLKI